jgi:hypothetical protein
MRHGVVETTQDYHVSLSQKERLRISFSLQVLELAAISGMQVESTYTQPTD